MCPAIFCNKSSYILKAMSSTITCKFSRVLSCLSVTSTVTRFQKLQFNGSKSTEYAGLWLTVFLWNSLKKSRHGVVKWQLAPSCMNQYCRLVFMFLTAAWTGFFSILGSNIHHHSLSQPLNHTTGRYRPSTMASRALIFRCVLSCSKAFHYGLLVPNIDHFVNVEVILTQTIFCKSPLLIQFESLEMSTKSYENLGTPIKRAALKCSGEWRPVHTIIVKGLLFDKCPDIFYLSQSLLLIRISIYCG